jgi:hypothetical protein
MIEWYCYNFVSSNVNLYIFIWIDYLNLYRKQFFLVHLISQSLPFLLGIVVNPMGSPPLYSP